MEHWVVTLNLLNKNINVNLDTIITMWITMLLLLALSFIATRKMSIFPTKIQLIFEGIIKYFASITTSNMGEKEGNKHLPLLLTLFMFILTANLLGQLPWKLIHIQEGELASCNNDINMTAAMAIIVSIYYIYNGIKKKGFHFFVENFRVDGIMIALVDLLELFVRPFSLALRLFANILAGEILVFTFASMCAYFLPLPFMMFEIFVAVVQALVFTLLSTTYISLAVNHEEE